jgi:molybdate transport system substrate-binding protein
VVANFPDDSHAPIVYPLAIAAGSTNPQAQTFVTFLHSPAAGALFEAQGFEVIK